MRRTVVLALALYGCVDSSGLANGKDAPEAGSDAAAPSDDAGTADNLLTNGDFELGCAAWQAEYGSMAEATTIRNGTRSCKLCLGTNFEAFLTQVVKRPVVAGESYVGEVWVKPAGSVSDMTTAGYVGGNLRVGTIGEDVASTASPPLIDTKWQRTTTLFTATKNADQLLMKVRLQQSGNPASQGNVICVFVDDAVLHRQ